MNLSISRGPCAWLGVMLSLVLLRPSPAYPQSTLTGGILISADNNGTGVLYSYWNTLGGDHTYDLWLALNANATSPVNGPSDDRASISISLQAGKTYNYYAFGEASSSYPFHDLNLFFDGDMFDPGISVYGPVNSKLFFPNANATYSLNATAVSGAGKSFYSSGGIVTVLTGFNWNTPANPPGNVCQSYVFSPGSSPVFWGSFSLQTFHAATLTPGVSSASPDTEITLTGSGFSPDEEVAVYWGNLISVIGAAKTDSTGFLSISIRVPQHVYGLGEFFALGRASGNLGAATLSVTPGLTMVPEFVQPGGTTSVEGLGFGAGETVSIYLDEPRQLLGTATANELGSFTGATALTVTIPASAPSGLNALIGTGATTGATGIGKVTIE